VSFVARTTGRVEEVACEHPVAHGIVGVVSLKGDIHPIAVQTVGELIALVNNASGLRPTPLHRSGTATPSQ
jgi:hypothetical protein